MKKIICKFLLISFFLVTLQSAYGQRLLKDFKEKTQQKIEQKLNEKANEKVDNEIDKQLDKLEESLDNDSVQNKNSSGDASQQRSMRMLKGLGIAGEPIPIAESYSFDQLIQMHIESFDNTGKKISEGEFITLLNKDGKCMAYQAVSGDMAQTGQAFFIIDTDKKATIILSDEKGKKTGLVYGLGTLMEQPAETYDDKAAEETPEFYTANPNVKKTGRTKTISGYKCEEYVLSDEDSEAEVWLTRDFKMKTNDFFSTVFKVEMAASGMGWGYLMESTSVQKDTGEKSVMQVTKVDPNANKKVIMSDYQVTNMGNIKIPQGE